MSYKSYQSKYSEAILPIEKDNFPLIVSVTKKYKSLRSFVFLHSFATLSSWIEYVIWFRFNQRPLKYRKINKWKNFNPRKKDHLWKM
jgi:hypothetical protein